MQARAVCSFWQRQDLTALPLAVNASLWKNGLAPDVEKCPCVNLRWAAGRFVAAWLKKPPTLTCPLVLLDLWQVVKAACAVLCLLKQLYVRASSYLLRAFPAAPRTTPTLV